MVNKLLPHFLSQMHGFVVDREMVGPSETLPTLLTLVSFLPWHGIIYTPNYCKSTHQR